VLLITRADRVWRWIICFLHQNASLPSLLVPTSTTAKRDVPNNIKNDVKLMSLQYHNDISTYRFFDNQAEYLLVKKPTFLAAHYKLNTKNLN